MADPTPEKAVIKQIREQNGVDEELLRRAEQDPALWTTIKTLKSSVAQSLQVLSAELYARPAHFVLEVIQNADDNTYPKAVEPTLSITLRDSYMAVKCNETGFSEDNVRAFCGIGQSTKRKQAGYIADTTTGAKSMFQVASKVYIQSRRFSFVLDRDEDLGMMSPRWVDDIPNAEPGWTTMRLEFCDSQQFAIVKKQLHHVRENILLFMRKLVKLSIDDASHVFTATRRTDLNGVDTSIYHTSSTAPPSSSHFVRVSETIKTSTNEPKRPHSQTTQLELCFPLDDVGRPSISWQMAYAYLPLRPVGLKFLVQADFLTAANREDILWDLRWNQEIVLAIPAVFIMAISRFQTEVALEFEWPLYLPLGNEHIDAFFLPAAVELVRRLQATAIVKCIDDTYRIPSMVRIPGVYRLSEEMLLPPDHVPFSYISPRYSEQVCTCLKQLGVRDMTYHDFVDGLLSLGSFTHQSQLWIERTCRLILLYGTIGDVLTDNRIGKLPLAQLEDGSWTCYEGPDRMFFKNEHTYVPPGLNVSLVQLPTEGSHRRQLLERIGIRPISPAHIMERIVNVQNTTATAQTKPDFLLEQVLWLFQHRFELSLPSEAVIYLPDIHGLATPSLGLKHLRLPAHFIHAACVRPHRFTRKLVQKRVEDDKDTLPVATALEDTDQSSSKDRHVESQLAMWHEFLYNTLGIARAPRVTYGTPEPEFIDMVNRYGLQKPQLLLLLLRKHWSGIQSQLRTSTAEAGKFFSWLGRVRILCQNNIIVQLRHSILPNAYTVHYGRDTDARLPLLLVDDPDESWGFLRQLGVSVEPDAHFFLKLLDAMSGRRVSSMSIVRDIYKQLEARFREAPSAIKSSFASSKIFFAENSWYCWSDVVWNGPGVLTVKKRMQAHYPTLEDFFQQRLQLPDAQPSIIVDELDKLAGGKKSRTNSAVSPERLEILFQALAYASSNSDAITSDDWSKISGLSVLPIRTAGGTAVRVGKMADKNWYLPDPSGHLEELFASRLDFIAFRPSQLVALTGLIDKLKLDRQRIDKSVTRKITIDGTEISQTLLQAKRNSHETQFYSTLVPYFQRLQHYRQSEVPLIASITSYNVGKLVVSYTADSATVTRTVECSAMINEGELQIITLANIPHIRRRGMNVAESIARALDLPNSELSLIASILRYEAEEIDTLLRRSGIHDIDPESIPVFSSETRAEENEDDMFGDDNPSSFTRGPYQSRGLGIEGGWGRDARDRVWRQYSSSSSGPQLISSLAAFNSSLNGVELVSDLRDLSVDITNHSGWPLQRNNIERGGDFNGTPADQGLPVGYVGEKLVFDFLKTQISAFDYQHWTSELRVHAGYPGIASEVSLADFVYRDDHGELTSLIFPRDSAPSNPQHTFEYLIEVKSTTGPQDEVFHMSRQQMLQAWRLHDGRCWHDGAQLVYVLFRVSGIGGPRPIVKAYLDPHQLLGRGNLRIESDVVDVRIVTGP
ncbi:hypothetical protein BKA62DRAFT_700171 [Auriculariales sp. MPI-PUGE-AT-0066]|nr:hypothetical protein BKA62DRAFT_700171 [Auriculariales sp. MPI-PUGE-AT-0066]